MIASDISSLETSSFFALFVWISMQYGQPVTCATATAMSSLSLPETLPSFTASLSSWTNALNASGASFANSPSLLMLDGSYRSPSLLPSYACRALTPCAIADPAFRPVATMIASASSSFETSSFFALFTWMSMQYGQPVTCATATAISSFVFFGMTPSATAVLSNAAKLLNASGASSANSDNRLMLDF